MRQAPQQARVPDPRQSPFDRAMDGVRYITVGERNRLFAAAKKRYMAAMKARAAAVDRAKKARASR